MKWSKKRGIAISLLVVVGISVILSLIGNHEAHAETVTIDIPYGQQFSGGFQAIYSRDSTKSVTLNAPYNNGKIISKVVLMKDGVEYQSYPEAVGQTSWSKPVTLTGEAVPLVTDNTGGTDSAQGYYAWYRYAQGDSRAPDWFSDIGGTIYTANDGPADPTYSGMTQYPGTSSTSLGVELTLSGTRIKPFKVVSTGAQWLDEASIDPNPSNFNTRVYSGVQVQGPGTVPDGYPDASTQYISTSGDINNFTVHYSQTFGESDYTTPLGLPGAAMTIYYAAFNAIIYTNTYKYPDKLVVIYDDAPGSPPPTTSPTPSPTPTPDNGPEVLTGDFTLDRTVMDFGDSNYARPTNVKVTGGNGSKIVEFGFTFTQDSKVWSTVKSIPPASSVNGVVQGFTGPPYPKDMGGGTVNVTMKIKTSLGTEKVAGPKSFTINIPSNNSPPVWKGAWFQGGNSGAYPPITQVLLGQFVDLGIVHDPTQTPNTPYDPDGDEIIYTWDFAGSDDPWIRAIGERNGDFNYDEHYRLIRADVLGTHTVKVSAIDRRGASGGTQDVTIEVMDPNAPPIPIITLPPKVVEGRTFTPDISGASSFSPIIGRTIASYSWTGKQAMYPTAGTYPITLSVTDSAGIQSDAPATADLIVQPDLHPVPQLENPGIGIRNNAIYFKDTSYSPDGDTIATHTTELAYDSNNDGSFADETYTPVTLDGNGNFNYTSSKVGKYDIRIYVKESEGYKKDATGHFRFEVVNEAPEADYYVEGSDFSPPIVDTTTFTSSQLLNDSAWKASSISNPSKPKAYLYNNADSALETWSSSLSQIRAPDSSAYIFKYQWWHDGGLGRMLKPWVFEVLDWGVGGFVNFKTTAPPDLHYWGSPVTARFGEDSSKIDLENNRILYQNHSSFGDGNFDKVFKISDIEQDALSGTQHGLTASPVYSMSWNSIATPWPPPIPASAWVDPPEKKVFNKDYAGNSFRTNADYLSSNATILEKLDPYGSVLWSATISVATNVFKNGVAYVSDNNSKLVVPMWYGRGYYIIDNNTGSVLQQVNDDLGYLGIDKIVDDKIVKIRGTPWYDSAWDRWIYSDQHLYIYDINTNATIDAGVVFDTRSQAASRDFTISADKKILFHGRRASKDYLFVYDLSGHEASKTDITAYTSTWDTYAVRSAPILMEDGAILLGVTGDDYGDDRRYIVIKSNVTSSDANLFTFGQLYNNGVTLANGEASTRIKLNYDNFTNEPSTGISARMADHKNMYRLEVTAKKTRIVKIVNGVKTILGEANYPLQFRQWYDVKFKMNGTRLKAYVNGVPVVEVEDSTFSSGLTGPYSEVQHSLIKNFSVTKYQPNDGVTRNTAIVGTPLNYIKSYSDTENDPAIDPLARWTYTHTNPNKFLDAGDGYSGWSVNNGQTVTAPNPVLDKVGEYRLDYQVPDDPAPPGYRYPDNTFAGYRKYSDVASHTIIIHRRPIAVFSLYLNGDNTVGWNDTSYDPDRWLSPWNYSTEPTGINYQATRGIVARKMNFTTPGGETRSGQLIRPDQTGTYTVRLAVKDEYGAWSDWAETTINIAVPFANNKPSAVLTFPNGTQANPSSVSMKPTLTWNQSDPDPGTIFTQFEVLVKDEYGSTYESKTSNYYTSNPSWSWTLDNSLDPGKKYWAQVRVWDDGGLASDWTNIGWMVTNTPPTASMSDPNGTQANPTIVSATKPTFTWNQTDPDPGNIFTQAEIQVTNEANTVTLYDKVIAQWTSQTWNSFQAGQDLPAGQKLRVRVRVWDNSGAASNWSAQTWFMINRPPVADFDWSPKPVYEGDTVQLTNLSTDPDGDSLSYVWEVIGPDGAAVLYDTTDVNRAFTSAGSYTVNLTVSDGIASSRTTKVIQAQPLTIQSDVEHTPEWLANHQNLQHNTTVRPIDFYSGEIFVVHTRSSPAPVSRAEAWLDTMGLDGNELKINTVLAQSLNDSTLFTGDIFDERLLSLTEGLPKGIQTIHFRIQYANGVIKEEDVPVMIIGNVLEFAGVHRVR